MENDSKQTIKNKTAKVEIKMKNLKENSTADRSEKKPDSLSQAISNILSKYDSNAHVIFHTDEHLSEYAPINYITPISNFTGSNAIIVMIQSENNTELLLYTDGRYFLQAEKELKEFRLMKMGEDEPPSSLLKDRLLSSNGKSDGRSNDQDKNLNKNLNEKNVILTMDMKKMGSDAYDSLKKALPDTVEFRQLSNEEFLAQIPDNLLYGAKKEKVENFKLIDLESYNMSDVFKINQNIYIRNYYEKMLQHLLPVDEVFSKMNAYKKEQNFLGKLKSTIQNIKHDFLSKDLPVTLLTFEQKRAIILSYIKKDSDENIFLLTDLTDIAWLLNLRSKSFNNGNFPSWLVISENESLIFTDYQVVNRDVIQRPYAEFWLYFDENLKTTDGKLENKSDIIKSDKESDDGVLGKRARSEKMKIHLSQNYNAYIHKNLSNDNKVVTNVISDLKAIKNDIELLGMFQANIIDGVALTKLFFHLSNLMAQADSLLTEIELGAMVLKYRQNAVEQLLNDRNLITQHSFEPIVGSGPDSAIIHYRPHEKQILKNEVLLLDTGGQYIFGTTDITRTIHFGIRSNDEKSAKDNNEFRKFFTLVLQGVLRSSSLISSKKAFPRLFCDIARLPLFDNLYDFAHGTSHGVGHSNNVHEMEAFKEDGQIRNVFSLEPGVYFPEKFGIRIENCAVSVLKSKENENFLTTMQLTFVPLQRDLIDFTMLDAKEKETLNEYNSNVYNFLSPYLSQEEQKWLKEETAPFE